MPKPARTRPRQPVIPTISGKPERPEPPPISMATPELPPAPTPAAEDEPERFTIPRDPKTGFPVWDRMRADTRDKLLKLVTDPKLNERGAQPTPDVETAALNAFVVSVIYDGLGLMANVFAQTRGYAPEAARVLYFSEDEKAKLVAPTVRVLDKYSLLDSKYQEEIMLAILLAGVGAAKFQRMQALQQSIASGVTFTPPAPPPSPPPSSDDEPPFSETLASA